MPNRTQRRHGAKTLILLPLLALAGCQDNLRSTATGAASNVPAQPAATTSPHVSYANESLEGTWLSPSCGERAYPRLITFEADGSFAAEDRVAPCPPGTRCVWSGIVYRTGRYSIEGETVRLEIEQTQQQKPGAPFPERLDLAPHPVERASADGGAEVLCAYSRQP